MMTRHIVPVYFNGKLIRQVKDNNIKIQIKYNEDSDISP